MNSPVAFGGSVGFDLNSLLVEDEQVTFDVPVITDKEGKAVTGFKIVGKNSPEFQQIADKIRVDNILRAAVRQTALDTSTQEGAEALIKMLKHNEFLTAHGVIVGWFGVVMNGTEAVFDPELVTKMLAKYPTWQEKILKALEVDGNFTKG